LGTQASVSQASHRPGVYASGVTFSNEDLAAIAAAEEIEIETRAASGAIHRTTIWVVVDGDVVFVRSVNGERGRWYLEAMSDPDVAIHVDGRRLPARAVAAPDPVSIEACSGALRTKYRTDPALRTMLRDHALPTTLRLEAA
jgi:hypothetical protein